MSPAACTPVPLLTAREVAEILRVSIAEVYSLKDRIGWVQVGSRAVRFNVGDVTRYMEAQGRCRASVPASSNVLTPRSGGPSGPTIKDASIVNPRVAATMARLRRGLRPEN